MYQWQNRPGERREEQSSIGDAVMGAMQMRQMQNALAGGGAVMMTPFGMVMTPPTRMGGGSGMDARVYNALATHGGPTNAAANALNGNAPRGTPGWDASSVPPEIGQGIVDTANALGISPLDLATAISYETAGTFDPMKRGPTTQWGQHRGLIQFGEPQAAQHGVDWNDPVASQLGPDGAVASYLRTAGVKPGMGLLDVYSAINAGSPGLYNRSDANNGGAPGTVRDKVNSQMAGHRAKAEALLQSLGL